MKKKIWIIVTSFILFIIPIKGFSEDGIPLIKLEKNKFHLVISQDEMEPVKLAAETLCKDFQKVMHFTPSLSHNIDKDCINIVIINESSESVKLKNRYSKALDDFESYRIYCNTMENSIYLHGKDMRGTIYAIYTFSEQFLDVPALWFYSSWVPQHKSIIYIPSDYDKLVKSPQVRYRAWFPNDTDLFVPWRKLSQNNNEMWLQTMLRLRLNTVELEATVTYPDYKLNKEADLLKKYGLILTSHHHVACNNNFMNWNGYWLKVRGMEPPKLLLSDEKHIREFWQYSIETVCRNKQENLWQISFRGINDQPFWAAFSDAPKDDKSRADVINRMMRIQLDMIKKATGEKEPFVRMTFYDELSDLLAKGYLTPPTGKNMLWTFVAGRRDHYPYDDLINFSKKEQIRQVKLGYYMNLQFTSTGAHLVPAEGPWKMEYNYRFVNNCAPITFSVVNAGNIREFVTEMAANAEMMWNMSEYNSDEFLEHFSAKYFGKRNASAIANIYKQYYYAYWQQKPSEMYGLERQFIFHDLRYARVFDQIGKRFNKFTNNPLTEIGFERVPGRTFRINGDNQVDSIISGMEKSIVKFSNARGNAEKMSELIDKDKRLFFYDNLEMPCLFMEALSKSLLNFVIAYKYNEQDKKKEHLFISIKELERAKEALYRTQHGVFNDWYYGDKENGKFNIEKHIEMLNRLYSEVN